MDLGLNGKVVIVTGAAGGIGSASARALSSEGATVVATDLPGTSLDEVVKQINETGRAVGVEADLADEQAVQNVVSTCVDEFGRIDALVNVAAAIGLVRDDRDLTAMEADYWDRVLGVNLRGAMLMCKHALPSLIASGSASIVNFTSTSAFAGDHGLTAYSASKAGVVGLTRSIATSYGRRGVRCNAIAPSGVWDEPHRQHFAPRFLGLMAGSTALPRLGLPEDAAYLVTYLCSEKASYITGQTIFVDGGGLAHQPWVRFGEDEFHFGRDE